MIFYLTEGKKIYPVIVNNDYIRRKELNNTHLPLLQCTECQTVKSDVTFKALNNNRYLC